MVKTELQEKRNKLIADATALMGAATVTAESRTQFDAMMADVAVLDADLARVEAVEKYNAELRAVSTHGRPNPGESADPVENAEVRNARVKASFRTFMQTGRVETRDLTVSANGAVAIPQLFSPQVVEAEKSYGQLYSVVDVMKTDTGDPMKIVKDDDTGNSLASVTVGTDASETDPTLTSVLLQVDTFTTGVVKIDNGLLTDAGWNLEEWIRDRFAQRFYRGASNLIYNGDGGNVVSLASSFTSGFDSETASAIKYADFATAIGTLDPAYQMNAIWAMNTATLGYVAGLTDSNGRPLFLPYLDGGAAGFPGTILGKPVKLVTQMPNIAAVTSPVTTSIPVLYGDFKKGYVFRQQNPGLAILRLNERYAASFETGFVGFCRCGGQPLIPNSGNPPIIGITV